MNHKHIQHVVSGTLEQHYGCEPAKRNSFSPGLLQLENAVIKYIFKRHGLKQQCYQGLG